MYAPPATPKAVDRHEAEGFVGTPNATSRLLGTSEPEPKNTTLPRERHTMFGRIRYSSPMVWVIPVTPVRLLLLVPV